jgi:hypothetical protein
MERLRSGILKNWLLTEAPHVAKDKKKRKPHNSNGYSQ